MSATVGMFSFLVGLCLWSAVSLCSKLPRQFISGFNRSLAILGRDVPPVQGIEESTVCLSASSASASDHDAFKHGAICSIFCPTPNR